jgi:hypothetical protein
VPSSIISKVAVCVCLLIAGAACAETPVSQPAGALSAKENTGWPFSGEAVVRVEPATVAQGDIVSVVCEVVRTGGAGPVYNPFLLENYKLPAQIVVTSADGRVRHELLSAGERDLDTETAWRNSGLILGRRLTVSVDDPDNTRTEGAGRGKVIRLSPGDYYVQAIYSHWYASVWPDTLQPKAGEPPIANVHEPRAFRGWSEQDMDRPLLISKPVKFVVVTRAAAEARVEPEADACPLHVELRPSSTRIIVGRKAEIEIRFVNQSDETLDVFDPTFSGFISGWSRGASVLAILDRDGNYIGDLLHRPSGSSDAPRKRNWVSLPPGGIIASKYRFTAGIVLGTQHWHLGNLLSPDKYFLELRVHERVLSSPWDGPNIRDWNRDFPGAEICRSQRVELELLPRTGD